MGLLLFQKTPNYHTIHALQSPLSMHHPLTLSQQQLCQYCSFLSENYSSHTSSLHVALITGKTRPSPVVPSLPILQCHFSLSFINHSSDNSLCIHCCTSPGSRNGLWLTSHHCCGFVFMHVDQKLPGLEKVI